MKTEIDRELLVRYINGKCTADELLHVKHFLQDPGWQHALETMLEADFSTIEPAPQADETTLEEWNQEFRDKYFKKMPMKLWYTKWIGYAAACLLVLGIGGYLLGGHLVKTKPAFTTAKVMIEKTNPRGIRSKVTLPDSSVVYLGAGSSIRYPQQFAANERNLTLTGEAFFEISKNPKRPFVIHTGEIQTTVLGTSFKITAFKDDLLFVEVATGKVRVSRKENTKVAELAVLVPGEGISWDHQLGKASIIPVDVSAIQGWSSGEITFKNRSLAQIADELENWYNIEIRFAGSASVRKRLSLSVDGKASLSDALDIICNTADLKYRFNGRQEIIISGNE